MCRRIKRDPGTADIPVLHLSASFISGEAKAHGLDGGADGYLVRPVEPVELVATVRALLRNKATEAALRASEEHLRLTVDLNPQVPWTAGPGRGHPSPWGQRWLTLTGLTREAAMTTGWMDVQHPDAADAVARAWRHAVRTGDPYDIEHPLRLADGTFRWMRSRAVPHRDPLGRIARWYGTTEDVDDQVRLRERNAQLLESERAARAQAEALAAEAERAGRLKDEFLATLSHELRTPLNAMLGWATIIRGGGNDPADVAQGIEVIERNARAQSQIIEDLLDMSRIISGKVRLDVARVDLAALVIAAVATARPTADAKGVQLAAVVDPLHGVAVSGDAARLQQVLWNLLSNAVKFTPRGGRVQVLLERVDSHLEVSVVDTGEGIPPAFLPYVFDRFRQADASTTRRHGGLGLGLSIVQAIGRVARRVGPGRERRDGPGDPVHGCAAADRAAAQRRPGAGPPPPPHHAQPGRDARHLRRPDRAPRARRGRRGGRPRPDQAAARGLRGHGHHDRIGGRGGRTGWRRRVRRAGQRHRHARRGRIRADPPRPPAGGRPGRHHPRHRPDRPTPGSRTG